MKCKVVVIPNFTLLSNSLKPVVVFVIVVVIPNFTLLSNGGFTVEVRKLMDFWEFYTTYKVLFIFVKFI